MTMSARSADRVRWRIHVCAYLDVFFGCICCVIFISVILVENVTGDFGLCGILNFVGGGASEVSNTRASRRTRSGSKIKMKCICGSSFLEGSRGGGVTQPSPPSRLRILYTTKFPCDDWSCPNKSWDKNTCTSKCLGSPNDPGGHSNDFTNVPIPSTQPEEHTAIIPETFTVQQETKLSRIFVGGG